MAATRFLVGDVLDALREEDGFADDAFGRVVFAATALPLDELLVERDAEDFGVDFFDFATLPLLTLV